ncbi:MAG: hypothetical protein GPJ15_08195 [Microcystis aeruginosa G11-06]|nr:hypothetical protein [Microcystis aeruginosa SX13-11]NCR66088.1 hypothetical protein [Microcystis aeruginosa LL11-07]NCS19986.1 hypothetical protein [Microcystis aeruginosa G11-06]
MIHYLSLVLILRQYATLHIPPQLYPKLQFYKYLHSSPSGFLGQVKSDRILSPVVNNADDKS